MNSGGIQCLVLQLSGKSDCLQSVMALRSAKRLYPNLKITFVCRKDCVEPVAKVPWIDAVVPIDFGEISKGAKLDLESAQSDLKDWIEELSKQTWDILVNWTFSEWSGYLASVIPAMLKIGYARRANLEPCSNDEWSDFVQAIVQGGITQNIHLTDLMATQLLTALQVHVGEPPEESISIGELDTFFAFSHPVDSVLSNSEAFKKKWLGVYLDESIEKLIGTGSLTRFFSYVGRRHSDYQIILLGESRMSDFSSRLIEEYKFTHPELNNLISLVGVTDFESISFNLRKCRWVLSANFEVFQLASMLGVRVLQLAAEKNNFHEVGPYGTGHYTVLVPKGDQISPDLLYGVWSYASSEWYHQRKATLETHFKNIGWSSILDGKKIYRSRIRENEEGGGIVFEPVSEFPISLDEWISLVMGNIARIWYCGWAPPTGQGLRREQVDQSLIIEVRSLMESVSALKKICAKAKQISEQMSRHFGKLKSEFIMTTQDQNEAARLSNNLKELETLVDRLAMTKPPLIAFARLMRVMMHNLKRTSLKEMSMESAKRYQQLEGGVQILLNWIKHTLKLSEPVLVKRPEVSVEEPSPEKV